MESKVILSENEALIVLCFFYFKNEFESQNELSRMWANLTQLNPNTYFHHSRKPIHELKWIEEIKEPRSNRLLLNEDFTNEIYTSKVQIKDELFLNFFTYCFLKVRYIVPKLTLDEKKVLIEESFDYISKMEIMSNISKLEDKIKKNVYKESFYVHYYLIKNGMNDLFHLFLELEEFNDKELQEFIKNIKNNKIEYFIKEFLKTRIKKSDTIIKSNSESRNLLFMNIKNLITEMNTSDTDLNEKLAELFKITKEIFNDGKTILDNFQERKNFISFLYTTVNECLTEGITV